MTTHPVERYLRRMLAQRETFKELLTRTARQQRERELAALVQPLEWPKLASTTAVPEYRHWYRLTEWPVALCGHLCPYATLREATEAGYARKLPACPECRRLDMIRMGVTK